MTDTPKKQMTMAQLRRNVADLHRNMRWVDNVVCAAAHKAYKLSQALKADGVPLEISDEALVLVRAEVERIRKNASEAFGLVPAGYTRQLAFLLGCEDSR